MPLSTSLVNTLFLFLMCRARFSIIEGLQASSSWRLHRKVVINMMLVSDELLHKEELNIISKSEVLFTPDEDTEYFLV